MAKMKPTQNTHVTNPKTIRLGILETLGRIRHEKLTVTVPTKLQPSLALLVKELGGSAWVRESILLRLQNEEAERE